MYYTTGFRSGEIQELRALVAEIQSSIPVEDRREWPPILGQTTHPTPRPPQTARRGPAGRGTPAHSCS